MNDEELEHEVEAEARRQQEAIQQQEDRRCAAYREVFSSPEGESVLEDLRRQCKAGEWQIPDCDPNRNLVRTGMQSVYWYIQSRLKGDE